MKKIPLHILDEYAKILTYKQAKKLYESKCHEKYKKVIYNGTQYQNKNSFCIFLSDKLLNEANISVNTALSRYVAEHHLQYNCVKDGVYLYTPLADNYVSLLEHLMRDGIKKSSLYEYVDNSTIAFLKS